MSLILEALKRSEAERQIGKAPGLMTPIHVAESRKRIAWWIWLLVLASTCVTSIAVYVWIGASRSLPAVTSNSMEARPSNERVTLAAVTEPEESEAQRTQFTTGSTPASESAQLNSARDGESEFPVVDATPPVPTRADPYFASNERESMPVSAASSTHVPVDTPPEVEGNDADAAPVPDLPVEELSHADVQSQLGRDFSDGHLVRLGELSAGDRQELPPLRITMHVYVDDPSARFVLLDGHKLFEGSQVASGLLLSRIRRDGIVLDRSGESIFVPRP